MGMNETKEFDNKAGEVTQSPEQKALQEVADLPEVVGAGDELRGLPDAMGPFENTDADFDIDELLKDFPSDLEPVKQFESTPTREMVDQAEHEQFQDMYDMLDRMDICQEYKEILVERFQTMPPELKDMYNRYADRLTCLDAAYAGKDGPHFSPSEGGFKLNQEADMKGSKGLGAGNDFFHESGHMIDWLKGQETGGGMESRKSPMVESVRQDLQSALADIQKEYSCSEEEAKAVLSNRLREYPTESNCVSDVFGALTGNEVRGRYLHDNGYWRVPPELQAASEAFAEITADLACGNQGAVEFMQTYMPKTWEAYQELVREV